MSENNEEYVSKHDNALRCEKRFCSKCLSLELFKATALNTVYYRCEKCGAMQQISDNDSEHVATKVVPNRSYARYGG